MLTRVLRGVRLDTIDGRSQVGVALRRTREELLDHVGDDATVPERILVDEIAKARIVAAAVGEWILRQESLVKEGTLLPVVVQHSALVANLARMLTQLGLERRGREVDIVAALAESASEAPATTPTQGSGKETATRSSAMAGPTFPSCAHRAR